MANQGQIQKARGSEKLLSAWKQRTLTEDSVKEIAKILDQSPASVLGVRVVGGSNATGVQVALEYSGDDTPYCGNDIQAWLQWLRQHGGGGKVEVPRIIIDGIPFPDILRLELDFGDVTPALPADMVEGQMARGGFGG
jgi:hypothetical protein